MPPEQYYLLRKTGEISAPPAEHKAYCREKASADAKRLGPRLIFSSSEECLHSLGSVEKVSSFGLGESIRSVKMYDF